MTPPERVERELADLKALPDIVVPAAPPHFAIHMGPWDSLDEQSKDELLQGLDWRGVDPADFARIREREVKEYSLFEPPSWASRYQGPKP